MLTLWLSAAKHYVTVNSAGITSSKSTTDSWRVNAFMWLCIFVCLDPFTSMQCMWAMLCCTSVLNLSVLSTTAVGGPTEVPPPNREKTKFVGWKWYLVSACKRKWAILKWQKWLCTVCIHVCFWIDWFDQCNWMQVSVYVIKYKNIYQTFVHTSFMAGKYNNQCKYTWL